jgi:LPXTG-motif cell wall-anchored protein
MRAEEGRAMIVWGVALGLAALGLVLRRRRRDSESGRAVARVAAIAVSSSLFVAGIFVWVRGATGGFYDDLRGATAWNLTMTAGLAGGMVVGSIIRALIDRRVAST